MTGEPRGPRQSVERLLTAARSVYDHREELASDLVQSTGLSREGVVLGFESLELSATEADLRALTGSSVAAERVHVILSANVFIAPLRAILLARVAALRRV